MPSANAAATSAYVKKVHELLHDLLDELNEAQICIGHAGSGGLSLAEIRWDLERLAMGNRSGLVLGVADEAALQAALEAAPGWRITDGGWQMEDPSALDRSEVLRQQLQERREAASAPMLTTRKLSSLTHLFRDSAYARVRIAHKLQQLTHICAAELQGLDAPEHLDLTSNSKRSAVVFHARRAFVGHGSGASKIRPVVPNNFQIFFVYDKCWIGTAAAPSPA